MDRVWVRGGRSRFGVARAQSDGHAGRTGAGKTSTMFCCGSRDLDESWGAAGGGGEIVDCCCGARMAGFVDALRVRGLQPLWEGNGGTATPLLLPFLNHEPRRTLFVKHRLTPGWPRLPTSCHPPLSR